MSFNNSINFWDGSVTNSFTEFKGLGASILSKCSEAKNRLQTKIASTGTELTAKLNSEIKQRVEDLKDKRVDLDSTTVDCSAFTVPHVDVTSYATPKDAYKAAYEAQAKACHEMEMKAVQAIQELKLENEKACELVETFTEKGIEMQRQQVESLIQRENNSSFSTTGGSTNKVRNDYINLMKSIRQNKPPTFKIEGSSPASFLVYLNEDFAEYCDEMLLENMEEKCFVLQKLFSGTEVKQENFRKKKKLRCFSVLILSEKG